MPKTFTFRQAPGWTSTIFLALASLGIPLAASHVAPGWWAGDAALLVWMSPLLPAFLLAYHRGWQGAVLVFATAMAGLTMAQVALIMAKVEPPEFNVLLGVILVYLLFGLGLGLMAELLHRERERAVELAFTDPLTGLPNRRHADNFLEVEFSRARRGASLSVVLFDMDHFKKINDKLGHTIGDEVLRAFGSVLGQCTPRITDLSARFGGEEFISILSGTGAEGARVVANRIRGMWTRLELEHGPFTFSAGIAEFHPGMDSERDLLDLADKALYRAKSLGRDQTVMVGLKRGISSMQNPLGRGQILGSEYRTDEECRIRILVIGNDSAFSRNFGATLGHSRYQVVFRQDPGNAILELEAPGSGYDLVLLDLFPAGPDTNRIVDEIRIRARSVPIAFMSERSLEVPLLAKLPGEVTAFLRKPVEIAELDGVVAGLVRPETSAA